jgi:hypothetical protein
MMLLAPKVSLEFWDHVHDKSIFNELRSLLDFFLFFSSALVVLIPITNP